MAGEEVVAAAHELGNFASGLFLLVRCLFGVAGLHQSVLQSVFLLVAVLVQVVVALFLVQGDAAVLFVLSVVRQHLPDAGWQLEEGKSWKGCGWRRCVEGTSDRLFFKHGEQHLSVDIPILLPGKHVNHALQFLDPLPEANLHRPRQTSKSPHNLLLQPLVLLVQLLQQTDC